MQQAKTLKSDIFSLAMVAVCCYNGGNPLHDARGNVLDYQTSLEKISRMEVTDMAAKVRPMTHR